MGFQFFSRRPKPETNFVLDVGTESVKALLLEKNDEKISVLGSSLEYYDQYSSFLSHSFEKEVVKRTISKTVNELKRQVGINKNSVILSLPPDIFVSRVITVCFKRRDEGVIEKAEKEKIFKDALAQASKNIAQIYAQEKGILPEDLELLNLRILETKIDGYPVPDLLDYDGKDLEFRILADVLPKYYLSDIAGVFSPPLIVRELGFKISRLTNGNEGLNQFLIQNEEGIFLDVGGAVTRIFLAKNGFFEKITELKKGGKDFSKIISERFGLQEPDARALKHRYAARDLREDSRARLRRFFEIISRDWFESLKKRLKEMSDGIFPSAIFIFGGGALLPEIKETLEEGDWGDFSFGAPTEVKIISPADLTNVASGAEKLNCQHVPALLMRYG